MRRQYLAAHFETAAEVWFVFPTKEAGEESLSYNDAVEEALCFGWIDSTNRRLDALHCIRRFSPRNKGSAYSQPNIERLIWLEAQGLIHPKIRESILPVIEAPFMFPEDILELLRQDESVWENYQRFSESYKRIRIAYNDYLWAKRRKAFRRAAPRLSAAAWLQRHIVIAMRIARMILRIIRRQTCRLAAKSIESLIDFAMR